MTAHQEMMKFMKRQKIPVYNHLDKSSKKDSAKEESGAKEEGTTKEKGNRPKKKVREKKSVTKAYRKEYAILEKNGYQVQW
eukprot:7120737-Ditylum_brightwellii.AAC.1